MISYTHLEFLEAFPVYIIICGGIESGELDDVNDTNKFNYK